MIENVFNTYNVGEDDEEESGDAELDTDEFLEFIYVSLIENGFRKYDTFKGMQTDPNFKQCFDDFDDDGSGSVSKDELKDFIRTIPGLLS